MIATLTLNPALDVSTAVERVDHTHKLRCEAPRYEAGGGGINVARVVHTLGGETLALFPSGGPNGARIEALLREAEVPVRAVPIAGVTRESFTVDEHATGLQYRFVLPGPVLSDDELEALLGAIEALTPAYVVASGSLPPDCDPAVLKRLAEDCRRIGARLVIDTSGPALAACEGAHAWLLKPSERELEELAGRAIPEAEEAGACQDLVARGFAETIVLSLGERGALLVADGVERRFPAIPVEPLSTVGAGDTMVAALVVALADGKPIEDAVRYGMAAAAATLTTPASELARREDVERFYAG